ncbi:MAG TPA: MATE family efflux transporter [Bryobacteraceae bacterium]|jgi:putative MATE family efflux protein
MLTDIGQAVSPQPAAEKTSWWGSLREAIRGSTSRDYTTGSIDRAIFMLSVPMVLEMCMESLFGIVDIFWVAKLGKEAMTAAALTEGTLAILFAVAMGLSMGTSAIVARRTGEKRPEEASVAAVQGMLAAAGVSLIVGILGWLYAANILQAMGASALVVERGQSYTRMIYGGSATILLLFLLNSVFRGSGDAATAMRSLWIANGINIILNPLLIFGVGPFPALGVLGSALGTTIGRGTGVLYQLFILSQGKGRVKIRPAQFRLDPKVMGRLLKLSLGGLIQYLIPTGSWTALVRMIATFGSASVAGYSLAIRILIFAILPSWGMSNAAATLVGQNLGAGKPERAEASAWRAGFCNMVFLGIVGAVFLIFAPLLVGWFVTDAGVKTIAITALRLFATGNLFYAYGMVLTQSFGGAGDTRTPTYINFFCYWTFQIPLAYLLAYKTGLGATGVLMAVPAAESALALVSIVLFRRGAWKLKQV